MSADVLELSEDDVVWFKLKMNGDKCQIRLANGTQFE